MTRIILVADKTFDSSSKSCEQGINNDECCLK